MKQCICSYHLHVSVNVTADHHMFNVPSMFLESTSLDDEWEKEFDIEVTEEDIRMAQEAAKKLADQEKSEEKASAADPVDVSRTDVHKSSCNSHFHIMLIKNRPF